MSTTDAGEADLTDVAAAVYGGPLEDFVARRDRQVKALRAAGRREAAAAVKGWRKPSRIAWALDQGALDGGALATLDGAVTALLGAQAAGGDVRAALAELRSAVRAFAGHAAGAAERSGHGMEPAVLANAVLAVIGQPDRFDALRRGALADVPEAGGLDFLASLPAPASAPPVRVAAPTAPVEPAAAPPGPDRAVVDAAREAARAADAALDEARRRWQEAQRAVRDAAAELAAAEARLREAEEAARTARQRHESAAHDADAAAARLDGAEQAAVEARRKLDTLQPARKP